MDIHLSHVAQFVECGFLSRLDVALSEVAAVLDWSIACLRHWQRETPRYFSG